MINYVRLFFENLSNESRIVAIISGTWGWVCSLFLLDVGPAWIYVIKSFAGICFGSLGIFLGLVTKDLYTYHLKNKIFKKNGNEKSEAGRTGETKEIEQEENRA